MAISPSAVPSAHAADVLHHAALAALQLPAGAPRPGQCVYSRVLTESHHPGQRVSPPYVQQDWISADGLRFGRQKISGGPRGLPPGQRVDTTHKLLACIHGMYKPASYVQHCSPKFTAGYLPNMPTSPVALRGYLQEGHDVADVRSAGHELDHSHGLA